MSTQLFRQRSADPFLVPITIRRPTPIRNLLLCFLRFSRRCTEIIAHFRTHHGKFDGRANFEPAAKWDCFKHGSGRSLLEALGAGKAVTDPTQRFITGSDNVVAPDVGAKVPPVPPLNTSQPDEATSRACRFQARKFRQCERSLFKRHGEGYPHSHSSKRPMMRSKLSYVTPEQRQRDDRGAA